jgi:hypothetical protein
MTQEEIDNLLPYQASDILKEIRDKPIPLTARKATDLLRMERALKIKAESEYSPE